MTAFLDPTNTACYHKPLNSDTCSDESFLDEICGFVGYDVVKKATENEKACSDVFGSQDSMTYGPLCKKYAKLTAEDADVCETCKYVVDSSGYHKACRFFMKAFHDPANDDCYHKPMNTESCLDETFMDPNCTFVGPDELKEAVQKGLVK